MFGTGNPHRQKTQGWCCHGEPRNGVEAPSATLVADDPHRQKAEKNNQKNQAVTEAKTRKNRLGEKPRVLVWQQVNSVTWRLVDPDEPQILVPRSHGQWPPFKTPAALAWVFDVGIEKTDWRVRIRRRGGWRAFGCVADVDTAKRIVTEHFNPEAAP